MPIIGENITFKNFTLAPDYCKESSILISAFPLNSPKTLTTLPDKFIGSGAFGTVWAVTDPRTGSQIALKKLANVFQNYLSAIRTYREIRILNTLKHENILTAHEFLLPSRLEYFREIYILMELMQTDLHKIMTSSQILTVNHIKLFLYQILRGLKYIHSAKLMHRDIKPGNLLVNSNCLLKICDFGLARTLPEDPYDEYSKSSVYMTTEVVTQYYRAPELLMGATWYNWSIDIWSVGCIFAELFTRKILFESTSPMCQLELITDILGTPSYQATKYACPEARAHFLFNCKPKLPNISALMYPLPHNPQSGSNKDVEEQKVTQTADENDQHDDSSPTTNDISLPITHEALHLLLRMLAFDPDHRISAEHALQHPFLDEGRNRFRDTFLRNRKNTPFPKTHSPHHNKKCHPNPYDYDVTSNFESVAPLNHILDSNFEKPLKSTKQIKAALHTYLMDIYEWKNAPLLINQFSPLYPDFTKPPPYSNSTNCS